MTKFNPSPAKFLISLPKWRESPLLNRPIVVVAGRSNVGKSSFINLILQRKNLARTSNTPGRTQLLNFFEVAETLILADVPGYGFATAPREEVARWSEAVRGLVREAKDVRAIILLLDIRRNPSREDVAFVQLIREAGRKLIPVATKADKISRGDRKMQVERIARDLAIKPSSILVTSAKTAEGRDLVWSAIFSALSPKESPVPPPSRIDVIAIDGPSGAGKSTVSKAVAKRLGWQYLDTGAMYRAVGLKADRQSVSFEDDEALERLCAQTTIAFDAGRLLLDGEDVSEAIREHRVSALASKVSARKPVRQAMGRFQRAIGTAKPTVAEGRDMGTVVFPDARLKVYLTASAAKRAERRTAELLARGQQADFQSILADIEARDAADSGRDLAPLRSASDAREVDTTELTVDEIVETIAKLLAAS